MPDFASPTDLMHNRGLVEDPEAFAREKGAASRLFLSAAGSPTASSSSPE